MTFDNTRAHIRDDDTLDVRRISIQAEIHWQGKLCTLIHANEAIGNGESERWARYRIASAERRKEK